MFKLTVVGGPAKGKSYSLKEDSETSIGRIEGNDVVLQSQKVSKKHCVLVVNNTGVTVKDAGSSNGTFVNGILTKLKQIRPGDRVSVGEYVFELVKVELKAKPMSNVIPIHGSAGLPMGMAGGALPGAPGLGGELGAGVPQSAAPPQNLQEKVKFYFDRYVLNFVYNLNEKHEWRVMVAGMIGVLVLGGSILSLYPVLDRVNEKLTNEAAGRALVLARQMVDRNAPFVFEKQESRMDISYVEREPGVTEAYIIDMEQRVLAPGRKLNQSIGDPTEAVFANLAAKVFYEREQQERLVKIYGDVVAVAIPLRIFSSAAGKNVAVAVGLVFFDKSLVTFDSGTEMLAYIQAVILMAIIAVVIYFAMLRLTLRPLQDLNEQIDLVLKGTAQSVEKKFRMEELNPLIDVVNSALQRAAQAGPASMAGSTADEALELMKFISGRMAQGGGIAIFGPDKKTISWGSYFEEITGIRADQTIGNEPSVFGRDEAFNAFMDDLFARAPFVGSEPVGEDFEFSGTSYRMEVIATGAPGAVKYYFMTALKPA